MSATSDDLRRQANQLRLLASHVENLLGSARSYAGETMTSWQGPHAAQVRGELSSWQRTCETVAGTLRAEAEARLREAESRGTAQ